jgi:hypothetical protein
MANDRSTMLRGASGDQQWAQMPGGRRMPSAPRERSPLLAVLALVLVVGGAFASGYLVYGAGKKVAAIEINTTLQPGQQIGIGDMTEEMISAADPDSYTPWSERFQVTKFAARTMLYQGTLLTPDMAEKPGTAQDNGPQVGLNVKAGEIPANLVPGDTVEVVAVVGPGTTPNCPVEVADQVLVSSATVYDVTPGAQGDTANVSLSLPVGSTESPVTAGCASDGDVAVVNLPVANGGGG